ncbi:hypothetical protein GMMP15_2150005 [Candidatus Magnetomoraceae bacterium gMMP-15]
MIIKWIKKRRDVKGSRWDVYKRHFKNFISWKDFKDKSLSYNPDLNPSTGWSFVYGHKYVMPDKLKMSEAVKVKDKEENIIQDVPYNSQLQNEWTYKYFGSDSDSKDDTPDGCWMTDDRPGGGYGKGAKGCKGPWEADYTGKKKGCIRPGSCNVTSLWMLLQYHELNNFNPSWDEFIDSSWLQSHQPSPSWLYYYIMEHFGNGKQLLRKKNDPTSAYNSVIVARPDYMQKTVNSLAEAQNSSLRARFKLNPISFNEYKQHIDAKQPLTMNSATMGHVICGIGYKIKNGQEFAVVHDPYGRKNESLRRWEKYNRCGEPDTYGKSVTYLYNRLNLRYILWIEDSQSHRPASVRNPAETHTENRDSAHKGIDFSFISELEGGCSTKGYVPDPKNSKSGVTIATGIDLGQMGKRDLKKLDITEDLKDRLNPYLNKIRWDAVYHLKRFSLNVTSDEAHSIDKAVKIPFIKQLIQRYNNASNLRFEDLPRGVQTVLASVEFQYGSMKDKTPNFWRQVINGDWQAAYENLMDFGDRYKTRRHKEASLLRKSLKEKNGYV